MNNKQRKIQATFLATVLLLGSGLGMVSGNVKADSATSATVIVDEPFTDLNILTRTKGSYTADMVYTMIYDTLFTLDANGNFAPNLVESWEILEVGQSVSLTALDYPNITYAPGWEVQPIFTELMLSESIGAELMCCTLRDDVTFQNETPLTVDHLIALVNYAKAQPTNTLIYQTWAAVTVTYIDSDTFYLSIDTTGFDYGKVDVLYNLALPQGSIVDVSGTAGYPLGTGAYMIDEIITESTETPTIEFERWEGWWNTTEVPTQYVTFKYIQNSDDAEMGIRYGEAAAAIIRDTIYDNQEISDYWNEEDDGSGQIRRYYSLKGNPLALFFNEQEGNSIFAWSGFRQMVTAALDKDDIALSHGLSGQSFDFWCYLTNSEFDSIFSEDDMANAQSLLPTAIDTLEVSQINVVRHTQTYFANSVYRQYYNSVCYVVEQCLNTLFEDYDITVNMIEATESQMAAYDFYKNYDIMLKEIDLHNINSAQKALYGKGNDDIDNWLGYTPYVTDFNTYMLNHLAAQYYNYAEESYVTNLGWQQRALLLQDNVSGVEPYTKFCPTGDSSRLDFRFIEVTTN